MWVLITIIAILAVVLIAYVSAKKERGSVAFNPKAEISSGLKKYTVDYDGRAETGQQYPFDIVGEASYQKNIEKFAEFRGNRDCFTELTATITREPNNSHDKNACRVDINGLTVGYFARNHAESWVRLLNKLEIPENSIFYVDAVIVGGGEDRFLGVRLNMPQRVASTAKYIIERE